ncbi:MAG: tRNA (N(6)-L-threonylcarbamoyladenosine(37)-C(2))-methylthiotransferase MtaB [Treponema sp.]|nr:tRNA (N(6)-L-threonylcarbamoyladenosine(37)-C(2))-methylthiotransferase MtaB [Candidatus Treponema equifaecale]
MLNKIHFETLGCKLNQVESEGAARFFAEAGFEVTMEPLTASQSDENVVLCVVNTCTVTAKAEQKARRIIRMLLKVCPNCAVAVTGCYAQLAQKEIMGISERVCVLGGQHKGAMADVPEILKKILKKDGACAEDVSKEIQKFFDERNASGEKNLITEPFRLSTDTFINHSRSSLKIQDGCNCVCTYCAIRLARGKAVSLDANEVVSRVQALEKAGQTEVVITTVNIGQYRGKLVADSNLNIHPSLLNPSSEGDTYLNFAGLLRLMLDNTQKIGIRISSLYPEIVNEELAELISNPRVRPHFHISVQSGSDAVLAKMKRPYKIEAVYKACELLKKAKGNPFLACDIIAGFPGETDEDFELTMKMLRECGFTFVHAFPFSARPGTEAFKMRPMVPNYVTDGRIKQLEEFNKKSKAQYILSYSAQILPAVCETIHRARLVKDRIVIHAVTENFLHCQLNFAPDAENLPKAGSVVNVKIRRPLEQNERTGESDTLAEYIEQI